MQLTGLKFDEIPSLGVPFRFYLLATVFAIIAGIFMVIFPEQLWLSRWTPAALSITHLLVLGVMAMIMFGSLFQLLPVLCGTPIPISPSFLIGFQSSFFFGVLTLVAAFNQRSSFLPALLLLALSVLLFIAFLLYVLLNKAAGKHTRRPMILAVISLLVTVILGLLIIGNYVFPVAFISKSLTNIHAMFGFFGWIMLLIIGVSFQVIPMFHVSPEFPLWSKRYLPLAVIVTLILTSIAIGGALSMMAFGLLLSVVASYAIIALKQLALRKRKLPDATVYFWQLGLGCLLVGISLLGYSVFFDQGANLSLETLIAFVLGVGFVLSVIQGMLLKIVPFLITLHLQQHAMKYPMGMGLMPDHYSIVPRSFGRRLFWSHALLISCLLISYFDANFTVIAGILLAVNWLAISFQITRALIRYNDTKQQMSMA